jgi:hypothetical protein
MIVPASMRSTPVRRLVFTLVGVLVLAVPRARADDPPAEPPPDRLEKKPRPPAEAPKPPEEPNRPQPPAETKPPAKPAEPPAPDEDAAKLRERIAKDMQSAEEKLKAKDPGPDTRQLQDRALRNIDKLIDLARNPPRPPRPSPMDQSSSPMGGAQQQPQGGAQSQPGSRPSGGSQSRRERREQRRMARGGQSRPMPGGGSQTQEEPGAGQQANAQSPNGGLGQPLRNGGKPPDKLEDIKDIWGHLPETLRQEVDHYYRDQFMPRYRDLLQQYYSRLAERDRMRGRER